MIEGQDAAIQKAIELEKQRQAELKRQQEEELKRQAAERQQEEAAKQKQEAATQQRTATQQQAPATTTKSNTSSNKPAASVSSSNFIRPTQGVVTSGFGYRIHPVHGGKKFHHGVDIAKAGTCSSCGFSFWGCFLFWANERLWKCDYYYSFH